MTEISVQNREVFNLLEKAITMTVEKSDGQFELIEMPLEHRFTDGMYSRQITMPMGTTVISERHITQNQFILSQGIISIWTEETGERIYEAPYHGVTEPGTKRALYVHPQGGDAIFTTFHSTLLKTVDEVYETLVEKYTNPLLEGRYKNNVFIPDQSEDSIPKILQS